MALQGRTIIQLNYPSGMGTGLSVSNCMNVTIRNLGVANAEYGADIVNMQSSLIESCSFRNGRYGLRLYTNSNLNTIRSCLIENNYLYGIYLWGASYNSVENCASIGNSHGLYVVYSCYGNTFAGNLTAGNWSHGLSAHFSDQNVFRNNVSFNNAEMGVNLSHPGVDNVFVQNTLDSNKNGCVWLATDVQRDTFLKNNFIRSPYYSDVGVRNTTPYTFHFIRNWWGTWDTPAIEARIYGSSPSQIRYAPYRLGPVDIADGADTVAPAAPDLITCTPVLGYRVIVQQSSRGGDEEEKAGDGSDKIAYRIYRYFSGTSPRWVRMAQVRSDIGAYLDEWIGPGSDTVRYRITALDDKETPNESFFSEVEGTAKPILGMSVDGDSLPEAIRAIEDLEIEGRWDVAEYALQQLIEDAQARDTSGSDKYLRAILGRHYLQRGDAALADSVLLSLKAEMATRPESVPTFYELKAVLRLIRDLPGLRIQEGRYAEARQAVSEIAPMILPVHYGYLRDLHNSLTDSAIGEDQKNLEFRSTLLTMVPAFFNALFSGDTQTALQYVEDKDRPQWSTKTFAWTVMMQPPIQGRVRGWFREAIGPDMERIRVSLDVTPQGATTPTIQIWTLHAARDADGTIKFGTGPQ